jgi:hypothetical protein
MKPGSREAHGSEDPLTEEWRPAVRCNEGSPVRLCGCTVALFFGKNDGERGKGVPASALLYAVQC